MNKKILFILFLAVLLVGTGIIYLISNSNEISFDPDSLTEMVQDRESIDKLREKSSTEETTYNNDLYVKNYDAINKRLLIESDKGEEVIDLRLTSPYVVSWLSASPDTKVAEFLLESWDENRNELFDEMDYFNVKEDYKVETREVWFKYGTEEEVCGDQVNDSLVQCYNSITWTRFDTLDELPHKNIKISMWTKTNANEKIEWIPTINGFKILEWGAWDITSAVYDGYNNLSSVYTDPYSLAFSTDGTKLYLGGEQKVVVQYDCSVAWNLSTCVNSNKNKTISLSAFGLDFSDDGGAFYVISSIEGGQLAQWNMSTAWDVSTATFTWNTSGLGPNGIGGLNGSISIRFGQNGSRLYTTDVGNESVTLWDCSTAWNLSSCNPINKFTTTATPRSASFNVDGDRSYIVTGNVIYQFNCSTAWDATTCIDADPSISISPHTGPRNTYFQSDGSAFYVTGIGIDTVTKWTINVSDTDAPAVTIQSPTNRAYNVPINFSITAIDDRNMTSGGCTVSIDTWVTNTTMLNTTANDVYNYSAPTIYSDGSYTALFSCTDEIGNINSSESVAFDIETINPDINITYPINNTNWSINTLNINFTRSDLNLESCWYSNDSYSANSTPDTTCNNITSVIWTEGQHNVTVWTNDTAGNENYSRISFRIDTINPNINITYPAINNSNWSNVNLDINFTRSDANLFNCWYSNDSYSANSTPDTTCNNITSVIWTEGQHNVTVWTNDTAGNENYSRISFTIDTTDPTINITYPYDFVDYQITDTNLTINFTASDTHLDSCWGSFDGGTNNISLTCADEEITRNMTSVNNDTFTFWANDSVGNINNITRTWIYKIFEVQQTFSETTTVGSTETFVNNIFLGSGETITEVNFNYNNTDQSASYTDLGGGEYNLSSTFVIPSVTAISNISFHWKIDLASEQINTSSKNQTVNDIDIDNCSSYSTVIFNYTLIDEETQNKITNTTINATVIELGIEIFDEAKTISLLNFSEEYKDLNPVQVCLNVDLTNDTVYAVDSTVRYEAVNYSIEYYNIQNFLMRNSTIPQQINLFDLKLADATEFQITFKDSNFVVVEDALIQINRQYIPEGLFKTVEIPKTDSNGQTVAHLVEKDIVYNMIVLKEGVILGTFNNVIAFCEDVVIGSCFISLNALTAGEPSFEYNEDIGLFYDFDYNETTRNLQFDFSTADGSSRNITLSGVKIDQLGNTSVCNSFLVSSSGTITCAVPISVGNETIAVSIFVDGDLQIQNYIRSGRAFDIGDSGYFLMFFLVLSLALMMTQSKTAVIIGVIIGFITSSLLSFIQGGILAIGSSAIWLIIMGIILIYKLNSQGQT